MESLAIAVFCWESLHAKRVGGLASAATNLAETLAQQHHDVHFFTRGSVPDRTINGVHYHYCQPEGPNIVAYCDSMSCGMVDNFHRAEKERRFDILHFHDWHPVQALHRLQDRDTILTFHSTEFGRSGNVAGDWWEYKEISGREWYGALVAKRVTTVSASMKREVMRLYDVPGGKCDVVPNGVVPQQYRTDADTAATRSAYGIDPDAPLVLFIGRLEYQKGPDILIDAMREVKRRHPGARAVVAGDGSMRQGLHERAHGLPVTFTGYIADPEYVSLLSACDLVAIPSRNGPFGLVLLEAWSAERCVIASDTGGLSENIDAFVNGVKVGVGSGPLAEGISAIIDEPWNAGAMGIRGRAKVERLFLWGPVARQMTDAYRRVS